LFQKSEVAHFLHVIGQELERKLKQAGMVTSSVTLKLMIRSFDAPFETEKYLGHGKCDTQNKTVALDHPTGCAQNHYSDRICFHPEEAHGSISHRFVRYAPGTTLNGLTDSRGSKEHRIRLLDLAAVFSGECELSKYIRAWRANRCRRGL
uniref:IMS_C domain-containing protein n=1 Tax=Haemonchus placei TaxID=6290 RepID=A0A0N4W8M9_HAEPC